MVNTYLSLCSIRGNQKELCATLASLLPSGFPIYLFLSTTPHLRDEGFANRFDSFSEPLKLMIRNHRHRIHVRFVDNTGPYRKLLPLLREKWDERCNIITVDDDTEYDPKVFAQMVRISESMGGVCVANRGFALRWDAEHVDYFDRAEEPCCPIHAFHTGKGAVLYRPSMFAATRDLIFDRERFLALAPYNDDFWFNLLRIANRVPCHLTQLAYMKRDLTNKNALYSNYNLDRNNAQLNAVLQELVRIGYPLRAHHPPLPESPPAPAPESVPPPAPESAPTPTPESAPPPAPPPAPESVPAPAPESVPVPAPESEPTPAPESTPPPAPESVPAPAPESEPTPAPESPTPTPESAPESVPESVRGE